MAILGLSLLALSFAGCGRGSSAATSSASSSADSPATADAGPRSRFIARADAICGRVNAEIVAIKTHGASAAEVIRVVPHTLSIERRAIDELAGLDPPGSIAGEWQRMLGYRRTLAGELEQLLALAKRNDGTSVKPLVASKRRAHTALSKTATVAGFKACSKIGRVG